MKTSARFLAMLLAVVMIASAALSVSAFSDVTAGVEHATAISVLSQLGVIGGYADGTFKPDQAVTRAEMAKLVYVLYTTFVDAGTGSVKFDDVKADNWAAGYISWCYNKAIIGGYGNGKFGPADNVTYDQALKMVCGTLGYNEWDSALWPVDVRTKALRDLDLGAGIPATVKGTDNLTRGQVAQIMYNALFANMAEKKMEQITLGGNKFFSEVPKVLAEDVWNFEEVTYEIMATLDDSLKLQNKAVDENDALVDSTIHTIKLEKLGLEEYEDKTADLIGLYITALVKDPEGKAETLPSATIKGSVVDGVAVAFDTTRKFVSIDGVKYYADDFAADARNQIKFVNADNTSRGIDVFGSDEKLTDAFVALGQPNQSYMARAIDYNGDGKLDAFVMVPKVAYKVDSVKTLNKVLTVNYTTLDGNDTASTPVANVSVELKKDDVFVGAKMGQTLYATIVEPVETYATKLSTGDKKVTLAEGGVVKYDDRTVDGVAAVSLSTATLGEDNKYVYYIYNGEILMTDASDNITDYNFAILVDVIKEDGEIDKATMTKGTVYKAVLLTGTDLKETVVTLSSEEKSTVAGVEKTAAQLYADYNATDAVADGGNYAGGVVDYEYTIVAAYAEEDGVYTLTINKDLDTGDDDNYVVIPTGANIKYDSNKEMYTIVNGGSATSMVFLDGNSAIYYQYKKANSDAPTFEHLGVYTMDTITTKSFGTSPVVTTVGETYLAKHDDGTYTLLATIVADEIKGSDNSTKTYMNDGTLILYAPESSSTSAQDKKLYNEYVFMDNATFENKSTGVDTTVEAANANSTVAGHLYGWDSSISKYVEVKAGVSDAAFAAVVKGVSTDRNLVKFSDAPDGHFKVDDSVTIWGLADANKLDEYTQLTLADLKAMFDLVEDYNAEKTEELTDDQDPDTNWTNLEIRMVVLQTEDLESVEVNDYDVKSIIVEIYEADEEGDVAVVNGTIHNNFGTLTQA